MASNPRSSSYILTRIEHPARFGPFQTVLAAPMGGPARPLQAHELAFIAQQRPPRHTAEGGQNIFHHRIPTRAATVHQSNQSDLAFLHGRCNLVDLHSWRAAAAPCNFTLSVLDAAGRSGVRYKILGALLFGWSAAGGAQSGNEIMVETLTIAHQGLLPY